MRKNADKCRKTYRAFKMLTDDIKMLTDDRQFNVDEWNVIMTLMSLHGTTLFFVHDKIWGI